MPPNGHFEGTRACHGAVWLAAGGGIRYKHVLPLTM
jgi:hypothetical protein